MNVYAAILAGGQGDRFGEEVPKQFYEIDGKPIIFFSIGKFDDCSKVKSIYVAINVKWIDYFKEKLRLYKYSKPVIVVNGGSNGLESARNLFLEISTSDNNPSSLVMIHDAARPFISNEIIEDNLTTAIKYGNAVTAIHLSETLVHLENETTRSSSVMIPRDNLMRVQTPQTFQMKDLSFLFSERDLDYKKYPSCFALFMANGNKVYCSIGDELNLKITYKSDLNFLTSRKN